MSSFRIIDPRAKRPAILTFGLGAIGSLITVAMPIKSSKQTKSGSALVVLPVMPAPCFMSSFTSAATVKSGNGTGIRTSSVVREVQGVLRHPRRF
ncbi:MAG: hypothetical protein IPP57_24180 [Candidatus Obscuribacter sp.]|nr:hypothetical protein [Candidatus Obscuribacter sp.]MBK9202051.1 hypothetical protein [Candidatus Obscuribacter sp.]MBK9621475.1 hypothetical protein [Candidatus Obscuribacter sp.]MBK9773875.1 hypothetical protein [Candidatus Obscuribacter sp.]